MLDNVLNVVGKNCASVLKLLGVLYNQLIVIRREPYVGLFNENKGCRAIVKRLKPSDSLLFGGKLTETAKNMFASDQLTMLTGKRSSASSSSIRGFGFARGSRGGYRGARGKPNKSFRGRAAKFGAKKEEN